MRYAVRNLVTFNALESCRLNLLALTLERMKAQIRNEGVGVFNVDTVIRPYPCDVGENSSNGYDKLKPRWALEIILTSDDSLPLQT